MPFGFGKKSKKSCNEVTKPPTYKNPHLRRDDTDHCRTICAESNDPAGCTDACTGHITGDKADYSKICEWNKASTAYEAAEAAKAAEVKAKAAAAKKRAAAKAAAAKKRAAAEAAAEKKAAKKAAKRKAQQVPYIPVNHETLAGRKRGGRRRRFTSEPIPDYIMRALKPKKSVHPEYGKLRY